MSSSTPLARSKPSKSERILSCVLCQQRKIKCDRRFPCANCVKAQTQCVPSASIPRQRKRRFPERELLQRLQRYEHLLRQNHVAFEPLHGNSRERGELKDPQHADVEILNDVEADATTPSTSIRSERGLGAKNIWHAMSEGFRDPDHESDSSDDEVRESTVKNAWDSIEDDESLLFGSRNKSIDISTLHPEPVQIFRLWQIYLDNINPLLKVTHTPSLQARIVEGVGNLVNIDDNLEALLFGIYCASVTSMSAEECQSVFGSTKDDLLSKYHFGCQQALLNAGFLRTSIRDCLTALFLYLISVKPNTARQSLFSILGVAMRIAERMGINNETTLTKYTVLEAEMCRRLWWALVLFDARIGEIANWRSITLNPVWDCQLPRNVSDYDLRPEMKGAPNVQEMPTESLFVVVRSELGEYLRHAMFHLEFTNPSLKPISKNFNTAHSDTDELTRLEEKLEARLLKFCDLENPLHFMAIWTSRLNVAKYRLLEHHSRHSGSATHRTEAQHDAATSYALRVLECDTKIMSSPKAKGFVWLNALYFPFPAYLQVLQDLKTRPDNRLAEMAWQVMSEHHEPWFKFGLTPSNSFFRVFIKIVLQAWEACETAWKRKGNSVSEPKIVTVLRQALEANEERHPPIIQAAPVDVTMGVDVAPFTSATAEAGASHFQLAPQELYQDGTADFGIQPQFGAFGQLPADVDMERFNWLLLNRWSGWGSF